MSEPLPPDLDPDSAVPLGDLKRFTKPKANPRRYVIPFVLATLLTVAVIALLTFLSSVLANAFH